MGKGGVDIGIGIVLAWTPNIDSLASALGMEIGAMGMGKYQIDAFLRKVINFL